MEILETAIYVYFYIQLFRWVVTFIVFCNLNSAARSVATNKVTIPDNVLWIAPVIYFSGGLV